MPYNPDFKKLSGGEALIEIPDDILNSMSTTQKNCYKLVGGIKAGALPKEMQEMLCDLLNHARWNSTGERLVFLWTRKYGLTGHTLKVLELLVKFCIDYYFKIYLDIKVKHHLQDGHITFLHNKYSENPAKVCQRFYHFLRPNWCLVCPSTMYTCITLGKL